MKEPIRFIFPTANQAMAQFAQEVVMRYGTSHADSPATVVTGALTQERAAVVDAFLNFVCFDPAEARGALPAFCITLTANDPADAVRWVIRNAVRFGTVATELQATLPPAAPELRFVQLDGQLWAFAFIARPPKMSAPV